MAKRRLPLAWVAVSLSVALHGLVGLGLLICWRAGYLKHDGPLVFDTRAVAGPETMEIRVLEEEAPAPLPVTRVVQPEAVPSSAPAMVARARTPAVTQPIPQAPAIPAVQAASPGLASAAALAGSAYPGTATGAGMSFFHVTAPCKTVVYVIDRSASMGLNGGLAIAKRELLASLERLPPETRFQVIFYNRSAEPLRLAGQSDLLPATADCKRQVALFLETLDAEGGTEHLSALRLALVFQPEVIFFLTDADDLRDDQIRAVTLANHGQTTIHTIQLTTSHRSGEAVPLLALAQANQGVYRAVWVGGGQ